MFESKMAHYPSQFNALMSHLKKLPGVGSRTAERYAFDLLDWKEQQLEGLILCLQELHEKIRACEVCNCLIDSTNPCPFCDRTKRNERLLCVIAHPKDAYTIEETRSYKGLYHVVGGVLSPLTGYTPEKLNLASLKKRLEGSGIEEVIIAIDSTLEGDTTALYIKEVLNSWQIKASRLAFGMPVGSSLDFVDSGTLMRAFEGRISF